VTSGSAFEELDRLVDAFVAEEPVPGVSYGVLLDGELIHTRGIGTSKVGRDTVPGPDTVFRIASMTKSFTAATVLLLRDEGLLRLDDPVTTYVAELPDPASQGVDAPPLTIRRLLTMSAGFPGDDPWGDRQQSLDLALFARFLEGGQSYAWMPGTQFEYSNLSYGILGRVITNVAGSEYSDVVASRLLQPLNMTSTDFDVGRLPAEHVATGYTRRDDAFVEEALEGYGALASMGGLFSTVRDLARWVGGFLRASSPRGGPDDHPLARASRLEMQQPQRGIDPELTWTSIGETPTVMALGYGFGLFTRSDLQLGRLVAHSGGYPGFGSHMRWHPASGLGVIVLGNRTYFPAMKVAVKMLRLVVEAGVAPVRRIVPAPPLESARVAIERLLDAWDDDLAADTFSMNVDLDEPIERRRAEIDRLREKHGRLRRSDQTPTMESPFHLSWWLEGERGRVQAEISLDPQPMPKVQWLELTSVPEPDPLVREAAMGLVGAGDDGVTDLQLDDGLDRGGVERDLVLVRTLFGKLNLGPCVAGDGAGSTFRVAAERGDLDLTITRDAETSRILSVRWAPCPVRPPLYDVR
jgi:CubicO group peptidase (beta-lactamase class C family)